MLTKAEKLTKKRIITRLAAGTIAMLVSFLGLALLGLLVFILTTEKIGFEVSTDGFLILFGSLVIASMGLYFTWIGFSILILKRITTTSFIVLVALPPIALMFAAVYLVKTFWERLAEGYGFLSLVILSTIGIAVFTGSFAFILKVFLSIFKKGGYLEE